MSAVSAYANLATKIKPPIAQATPHSFLASPPHSTPGLAPGPLPPVLAFPSLRSSSHPARGEFAAGRCRVRGCVYPAGPTGSCLHHQRQASEPRFFQSHQPTMLLLDRARFDVPDSEPDDTRAHDRRRLAAAREAFLEEAA